MNNFVITVLGLAVLSSLFFGKNDVIESFGMLPGQKVIVDRTAGNGSVQNQYQQMLNPSAAAQMRPQSQMASAPLSYVGSIKEKFCGGNVREQYSNGGCRGSDNPAAGASMMGSAVGGQTQVVDMLPVQSMANAQSQIVNALGEASLQPIVYDRYIYSNQRSRLYGQGDPIRGDLPIVPDNRGWFSPSVRPNIDLRSGALAVMGGTELASNSQLLAMQNASSGGIQDTGSGIAYTALKNNYLSTGSSDIRVTAFP